MPVVLLDPTQTGLNILPMGRVGISDPGAVNSYARVFGLPCCGWPETTLGLVTHSTMMLQKGSILEAQRTPIIRRYLTINAAGVAALWTPAAGNRFHLMGITLTIPIGSTAAAALILRIQDAGAVMHEIYFSAGALAATTVIWSETLNFPGNGLESTAVNNPLNLNLLEALTAGRLSAMCWGFEDAI